MFRVVDDRPGSHAAVSVARPGPLRVYVHVRASADSADLTALRVLLTADLLVRAAELSGLQVLALWEFTGEPAGQAELGRAAATLGIHPPALPAAELARGWPGGPADVHVADDGAAGHGDSGGILVRSAAARLAPEARPGDATGGAPGEYEPLAVRFALLSLPRSEPVVITAEHLSDAARTLADWRYRTARWAESPSGAIPAPAASAMRTAFGNLDSAAVLALLSSMATDETLPPGPRFETFVYADRVLGLDLPRDIGR